VSEYFFRGMVSGPFSKINFKLYGESVLGLAD
jgi:hypothetical protein